MEELITVSYKRYGTKETKKYLSVVKELRAERV